MKKPQICHVTSVHKPFDTRIFFKECSSLARKYDVSLVVANTNNVERNGVHVVGVDLPTNRFKRRLNVNHVIPTLLKIDACIYHFHDPELLPIGIRMKKKYNKKVVFDSHEDIPMQLLGRTVFPDFIKRALSFVYALYEKQCMKKFDALVSVTPTLTERLRTYNKYTYQITNYPIEEGFVDHRKWDGNICFAGGIAPQWMHKEIINVLDKINVKYTIAGPYYSKDYFASIKSLSNWGFVDYKGRIPHEDVTELLQQSSAGMALIKYNASVGFHIGTLGNTKLFEYMQAGIPVIATDLQLWKEIVDEYHCGICINPYNQNEIIDAIKYIISHPEEARRMGENGRRAIKEKFNWATQEKTLYEMYDCLLNSDKSFDNARC